MTPSGSGAWVAALGSAIATLLLMPVVERAAHGLGWVSQPRADRWHSKPVALMGGVALAIGLAVGLIVSRVALPPLVLPALGVLFFLGLVDDRRPVGPWVKLVIEGAVAIAVVLNGERFGGWLPAVISVPLTALWVMGITNSVNMLDNMNGLAAGFVAVVGAGVGMLALVEHDTVAATIGFACVGSCLAYLPFNFPRARVFMGDAGSLVLGFMVAWLSLRAAALVPVDAAWSRTLATMAVASIALLDTGLVVISRRRAGKRVMDGGRDHSSHRLVYLGSSDVSAVLKLHAVALGGAAVLAVAYLYGTPGLLIGGGSYLLACLVLAAWLDQHNPYAAIVTLGTVPVQPVATAIESQRTREVSAVRSEEARPREVSGGIAIARPGAAPPEIMTRTQVISPALAQRSVAADAEA